METGTSTWYPFQTVEKMGFQGAICESLFLGDVF